MRTPVLACLVVVLGLSAVARAQPGPAAPPAEPAEPAASPAEAAEPAATSGDHDVDALRQQYLALRDRLFRSRARAAAVASALYSSKLRIVLGFDSARHYTVTRATVRLDGASVYDDSEGEVAKGGLPRFEGFVAPGRHVVAVRIEATAKDDERFVTATEWSFVVQVPQGKDVVVTASAEDDGDIGYAWRRDERGTYDIDLDVSIKSEARAGKPRAAAGRPRNGRHRASR